MTKPALLEAFAAHTAVAGGLSLVAGYDHWWDFTDSGQVTASGGKASAIADKGSSPTTLSNSTSGNQPAYGSTTQNGHNTASFDTGDQLIGSSTSTFAYLHQGSATVFVAFKQDGTYAGTNLYLCGTNFATYGANTGMSIGCYDFGSGLDLWASVGAGKSDVHDGSPQRTYFRQAWTVAAVTFDSTSGDTLYASNSSASGSWSGSSYSPTVGNSAGYFAIGAGGSLGETDVRSGFGGEIAMVVTYASVLSGSDVNSNITAISNYLAL